MRVGARLIILTTLVGVFSCAAILSKLLMWEAQTTSMLVNMSIGFAILYVLVLFHALTRRRRRRY